MTKNVTPNDVELGAGIAPNDLTDAQVDTMIAALAHTSPTAPAATVSRNVRCLIVLAQLIAERHAAAVALKSDADARLAAAIAREEEADIAGLLAKLAPGGAARKGWFR